MKHLKHLKHLKQKPNVNFARSNIGFFRKKSAKVIFFIFLTR